MTDGDKKDLALVRDLYDTHCRQQFHNAELADMAFDKQNWEEYYTRTRMAERNRLEMLRLDELRNNLSNVMSRLSRDYSPITINQ